jgi:hypothetical protein
MKDQIKSEQTKWMKAMQAGDVAAMVRCSERLERLQRDARVLNAARRVLTPMIVGGV